MLERMIRYLNDVQWVVMMEGIPWVMCYTGSSGVVDDYLGYQGVTWHHEANRFKTRPSYERL